MYTHQCDEKCLVHRGECFTTGGLYGLTHLCVAHLNCKKKNPFFLLCGKVGGGGDMFQEVGVCMGFQGGRGI